MRFGDWSGTFDFDPGDALAFRNDENFAQDAAKIESLLRIPFRGAALAALQKPQHVLDVDEAEDVIDVSAVDGNTGTLGGGKNAENFVERSFDGKKMQVRARNHDFANLDLAEFDGAEDDFFFAGGEQSAFASLLNLDLEFFGGVSDAVAGLGIDAHGFDDGSGSAIEKFNGPAKSIQEPVKGPGDKEGDAFGAGQADGFGNKLADDYVQSGEESERGGQSEGVGQNGRAGSLNSGPERAKEICQSGFAESAESETGESDAKLNARDDAVQVGDEVGYDFCADITGGDQLANAGG